jgi:phenylalanyl-tRNA synthetase beta subunit
VAVQVLIQSMEKTLTDAEIEGLTQRILMNAQKNTGAELRQ